MSAYLYVDFVNVQCEEPSPAPWGHLEPCSASARRAGRLAASLRVAEGHLLRPASAGSSLSIYHLHVQLIRRSQGRSSVASAAYRSANRLYDQRLGRIHSYLAKAGVVYPEVLAPVGAPAWARERRTLLNRVEACERRCDAQVARDVRVALPVELSVDAQVALVRRFAGGQFTRRGMVADVAIHHDNPHAHIGLTLRPLDGGSFGAKARSWTAGC